MLYREQRNMLLPKKLIKTTRFKAMALPPAGDELLGSVRQWETLVFSCLSTRQNLGL